MKKETALTILRNYGSGKTNTNISFARCNINTIKRIEGYSFKKLFDNIKSLYYMNYILEQVSLYELQELDLSLAEADSRGKKFCNKIQRFFDSTKGMAEKYEARQIAQC